MVLATLYQSVTMSDHDDFLRVMVSASLFLFKLHAAFLVNSNLVTQREKNFEKCGFQH